jgi:acylaminoacyl-peptidase
MLPEKCFLSNDDIIISEVVNDTLVPIICNIKSLDSIIVKNDYAYFTTTDVSENGKVIAVKSTPLETPSLWIGTYADGNLSFKCILEGINLRHHLPSDITFETLIHTPTEVHEDPEFKDVKYSSIYVGPTTSNWPLITWPHGGPHSVVTATFSNDILFYLKMGYGVLLPNYRGSLGAGQAGVLSLTAHVGNYDVKDCQQAVQDCLERFSSLSKDNLLLYGGSHGGSIVTHLAGQFPDDFKAVVARNPVINVSTKVMTCDNPDSGFNSTGIDFEYLSPEPEVMATMFYNSAISHVNNVKIPVHLNLGTLDRRVVKTQGIELYRNLKALGKDVSVNIYEDNHPLAKVSTHTNIFINTVLFFKSIIKKC